MQHFLDLFIQGYLLHNSTHLEYLSEFFIALCHKIRKYVDQIWLLHRGSFRNIQNNEEAMCKVPLCMLVLNNLSFWYMTNTAIHRDLEIETVEKEIECYIKHHEERLRTHFNELATNLLNKNLVVRRLKRFKPLDLRDRFK